MLPNWFLNNLISWPSRQIASSFMLLSGSRPPSRIQCKRLVPGNVCPRGSLRNFHSRQHLQNYETLNLRSLAKFKWHHCRCRTTVHHHHHLLLLLLLQRLAASAIRSSNTIVIHPSTTTCTTSPILSLPFDLLFSLIFAIATHRPLSPSSPPCISLTFTTRIWTPLHRPPLLSHSCYRRHHRQLSRLNSVICFGLIFWWVW